LYPNSPCAQAFCENYFTGCAPACCFRLPAISGAQRATRIAAGARLHPEPQTRCRTTVCADVEREQAA